MEVKVEKITQTVTTHQLKEHKPSAAAAFFSSLVKSKTGFIGFLIIAILLFISIFGQWIVPFDPLKADFAKKLLPPMTDGHLLGTDQLGRDIFSRIIMGARVSVIIGATTV